MDQDCKHGDQYESIHVPPGIPRVAEELEPSEPKQGATEQGLRETTVCSYARQSGVDVQRSGVEEAGLEEDEQEDGEEGLDGKIRGSACGHDDAVCDCRQ